MKKCINRLFLLAAVFCGLTSFAALPIFNGWTYGDGGEINCPDATTSIVNNELVIQYKTPGSAALVLPETVTADYLVVGGGGGGGHSKNKTIYGGNGGAVVVGNGVSLVAGTYQIAVGAGGTSAQNSGNGNPGGNGGESSFGVSGGDDLATAAGGTGGTLSAGGVSGTGSTSSLITGSSVTYGTGGKSQTGKNGGNGSAGGANTGVGGGAGQGKTATAGAGGSGIVVVRIKSIVSNKPKEILAPVSVVIGESVSVDGDFASMNWVSAASALPAGLVSFSTTQKTGALTVYGLVAGKTTLSVETQETIYRCEVTVTKPVTVMDAKEVYLGDSVELTGEYSASAWTATEPDNHDVTLSATSGAVGQLLTVTGAELGTGVVTIETANRIYTCAVTVKQKQTVPLTPITMFVGETETIVGDYSSLSWSARLSTSGIVNLSKLSGTGTVTVTGVAEGAVTVLFNTTDILYTCLVTVLTKPTKQLPPVQITINGSAEIGPESDYQNDDWTASASPSGYVTLSAATGTGVLSVTGTKAGTTTITIETEEANYTCIVTVGSIDYDNYRDSVAKGDPQSVMLSYWSGIDTRGFAWQQDKSIVSTDSEGTVTVPDGSVWIVSGNVAHEAASFNGATPIAATKAYHTGDCVTYLAHTGTLQPGAYTYRLGTTGHYAYGNFTVGTGTDSLMVFNFSDVQMKYKDDLHMWREAVSAANQALGGGKNADFILSNGDFYDGNYPTGYSSAYLKWGVIADNARTLFPDVPFMMTSGNHDTAAYSECIAENYTYKNGANYGCHSFNYGGVHIATVPFLGDASATTLPLAVSSWLESDLANAQDAKWRIVSLHYGPYTTGDHGLAAGEAYIKQLTKIFAEKKVDLVIQAHDHTYSKTLPYLWSGVGYTTTENNADVINLEPETVAISGVPYYLNPEGTIYIGDGSAGDRVGENVQYATRGYGANSYEKRTYKVVTDKINVTSAKATAGDDGSKDVDRPMFGVLKVNGNLLDYEWYYADENGRSVLFDTLHITKKNTVMLGSRTVVVGESVTVPRDDETWGDNWQLVAGDKVGAVRNVSDISISGLREGESSVTISTADFDYIYTVYVVRTPFVVEFCQGDEVQIWYHNTMAKNWFLLMNDTRFEVNDPESRGEQMQVTLFASNPNEDSYIKGIAETIGPRETPDLVVIADGENFYSYRMSVGAPRRIAEGASVDMTCSTVAENVWKAHVEEDSQKFVSVVCDSDGVTPSHSTTATITGIAPAAETWVVVDNQKHEEGEVNAQGAVYRLKTQVTGAATVEVHLSAGVSMDVAGGYADATDTTQYRVTYDPNDDVQTGDHLTFEFVSSVGKGFVATLAADSAGVSGMTTDGGDRRTFVVQASNDGGATWENVIRYVVNVTYSFSFETGLTIPGFLYGAPTPWVTRSSDPSIVAVEPTVYREMYSAAAKSLSSGDCCFYSTNVTLEAGYWGIKAKVYEIKITDVDMPLNSTTNFTVTCDGRYLSPWAAHPNNDRVNATLSTADAVQSTEVTFVSGSEVGQSVVEVSNGYYVERFRIFVSDSTKTKIRTRTSIRVMSGGTVVLPAECYAKAWTVKSDDTEENIISVPASGAAGQPIVVTGVAVGRTGPTGAALDFTDITVENDDEIYIVRVEVYAATEYLPPIVVGVGESATFPLSGPLETAIMGVAQDGTLTIDNITLDPVNHTYTVKGRQEGETAITFTTGEGKKYIVPVTVHQRHIDKYIDLVIGGTGTSSYSYTFDAIVSIENEHPDAVAITQVGNTLTFTPKMPGQDMQVFVTCFVDGLTESSVLHYWFNISQLEDQELKIWQLSNRDYTDGAGYIAYKGESQIYEDDSGELVIVFDNAEKPGTFVVPEDFAVRADFLAVGGGGAGGSAERFGWGAGGGGAGGLTYVTNKYVESGTFTVSVGQGGGAATAAGAAQGASGGASSVTNTLGKSFVAAAGGGGGAAPATSLSSGIAGGSGGGGAWADETAGAGGAGIAGQGARGGVPEEYNFGGGGGGAGGLGGADSFGGDGKVNTITGVNVLYAQGGDGGAPDSIEPAVAGNGPGFGGAGGNGGPGGAGADGTVVVRIRTLKTNVLVPVPTTNDLLTARFLWEEGVTCNAFAYDGQVFRSRSNSHPYFWADAIDHIDGVRSVRCQTNVDGDKIGLGTYRYTVYLKDGFAWDDGEASIDGKTWDWVVTEDLSKPDSLLKVSKNVSETFGDEAIVEVIAKTAPEATTAKNLLYEDWIDTPEDGLTVEKVTVSWCTTEVDGKPSENPADWKTVIVWNAETGSSTFDPASGFTGASLEVDLEYNFVSAVVSNVTSVGWMRYQTQVRDTGIFRTSLHTTHNPKTGRYEKDPNDGDVTLVMIDDEGNPSDVHGSAQTERFWAYDAYPITASAVNGEAFIAGVDANPLSVWEGATVPVYYRGEGGYRLNRLLADGVAQVLTPENASVYMFDNLSVGHDLAVEYVSFVGDYDSESVTTDYDGAAHLYPVTLTDWDATIPTEVRYATRADADESEYLSAADFIRLCETNDAAKAANTLAGEHRYWYRVFAFQSGWGETFTESGWVATEAAGDDIVTIAPHELVVQPKYYYIVNVGEAFPDDVEFTIEGFVDGDDQTILGDISGWKVVTGYNAGDPKGQYETRMSGAVDGALYGDKYKLVLKTGILDVVNKTIEINGVKQAEGLDPKNPLIDTGVAKVEKSYDGEAASLAVNVTAPASGATVSYRIGDDGTWQSENPTFTHAGTYKVWYKVEHSEYFPVTNYQYVTITPLALTLRSKSAEKQYDQAPLVCHEVEVVGGSFHAGKGFDYSFTGSQTAVGTSANAFGYTAQSGTDVNDYAITAEAGTLTVTPAPITIGGIAQSTDPTHPNDQDHNGVDSINVPYTGLGTNIVVNVTLLGGDTYTIRYSTNREDAASWTDELWLETNVCNKVVYYAVEADNGNYAAVTNFAQVMITPRVITVKADAKTKEPGAADPEFTVTATVDPDDPQLTAEARTAIEAEIADAIAGGEFVLTRGSGNDQIGYPIIPTGPSVMGDGNFTLTYVNGHLSVLESPRIVSLWIVGHEDGGEDADGNQLVNLALAPTYNRELTETAIAELVGSGIIKAACATTEAGLAEATPVAVSLRSADAVDTAKGWVWVTVTIPKTQTAWPLLWKIVVIGD